MNEKLFEIDVVELASAVYTIRAETPQEAVAKLRNGEWEGWRDLGHDAPDILEVREVED